MKERIEKIKKISEKLIDTPCARIGKLWEEKSNNRVVCNVCERRCVIPENMRGMCGARYNYGGQLYVLTYGNISSISNNPMSKKPFFHFFPDEYALTVGSWGCNFTCPWCQNWEISKVWVRTCNFLSPEKFLELLKKYGSTGTSFSFNEPVVTLLEYSLVIMPKAKKLGYFNTYVTNGYMTEEALMLLIKSGLDAVNIDVKGCSGSIERWIGANVDVVWRNIMILIEHGVHVELTTLVIPKVNDSEYCLRSIARFIAKIDRKIPWHVTRYYASFKAREYGLPERTPVEIVEKAWKIGKEEGLEFVYVGNIVNHPYENTYCPKCGELLIRRYGIWNVEIKLEDTRCPECGEMIPIVFRRKNGELVDWRKQREKSEKP